MKRVNSVFFCLLFISSSIVFCQSFFSLGSTKDEVRRIQGTPTSINKGYRQETWNYNLSSVTFQNDRVTEWSDYTNVLKVRMTPGANVTGASQFTRGSHKDDVLQLQGTPQKITRYPSLGYETWAYNDSIIKLSILNNDVADLINKGNLAASMAGEENQENRIKYHHRFGDVTLYYDEEKIYRDIFSIEDSKIGKVYGLVKQGIAYYYDSQFRPLDVISYYNTDEKLQIRSLHGVSNNERISYISSKLGTISISGDIIASGTVQKINNMTLYNLVSNYGTYVHGTTFDFKSISFDNFSSSSGASFSGSRFRLGNISFGNWTQSNEGTISGSTQRLGNILFHNYFGPGGRKLTGTTIELGDFSFTNLYDWNKKR